MVEKRTVMKFGISLDGPDLMEQNLQVLFLEELETQNSISLRLYPVDTTRMVFLAQAFSFSLHVPVCQDPWLRTTET